MSSSYIPSTTFRSYVNLFGKLMDLPATVMLNVAGVAKEHIVFHRLELDSYDSKDSLIKPSLKVRSYAILAAIPAEVSAVQSFVEVNPEFEFTKNSVFWAGSPTKVFKDFSPLNDKKYGALTFCASYERDLYYPTFAIDEANPLFTMTIALSTLDQLEVPEVKATKVGLVTEDGEFIPAKSTHLPTEPVKHVSKLATPIAKVQVADEAIAAPAAVWSSVRHPAGLMHRAMAGLSSITQPVANGFEHAL